MRLHQGEVLEPDQDLPVANTLSSISLQHNVIHNDIMNMNIRMLNTIQRKTFEYVCNWTKRYTKNMNSLKNDHVKPIVLFVSGGAGVGKSKVLSVIDQFSSKILSFNSCDKLCVLKLAPTGVAAINIDGSTIHSVLGIPIHTPMKLPPLGDKVRSRIRLALEHVSLLLIDEVSMIANKLLIHVHMRLTEIFATFSYIPFANKSVIAFGDLYQLPPVRGKYVFAVVEDPVSQLYHFWHLFQMVELVEVVRQQGDNQFIQLLNNLRVGNVSDNCIKILQSKIECN